MEAQSWASDLLSVSLSMSECWCLQGLACACVRVHVRVCVRVCLPGCVCGACFCTRHGFHVSLCVSLWVLLRAGTWGHGRREMGLFLQS